MSSEKNPLDLNNFPDDFYRESQRVFDEGSSSSGGGCRRQKNGGKDGKDESGKVYECRFCSLKFCKSQALGGHMNRHRQERETETLNRARQLVLSNDAPAATHLGYHHPGGHIGDPTIYRSMYGPRMFNGSSTTIPPAGPLPLPPPPPPQSYLYPSRLNSFGSQYHHPHHEYYVGHVLASSNNTNSQQYPPHSGGGGGAAQNLSYVGAPADTSNNYTCIGAPVAHGSINLQENGLSTWGRSYAPGQRLDPTPSSINRF